MEVPPRDFSERPIIAFLMLQGCRPGEVRALKCKDVNLHAGTITVARTWSRKVLRDRRKGRGAKAYVFPIHEELLDYIADRVNGSLPEAWLFSNPRTGRNYTEPGLKKLWHRIREKAELGKNIRLYDATRHSFASNLINKGDSLYMVSQLLGHSDTRTTEKYSHASILGKRTTLAKLSLKNVFPLGSDRAVEEKSKYKAK
jgi:integrase